ncbi:MAG: hypothetical protein U5J95_11460 [Balneolaceae bacterium]|nr:hypothetical protein [Balneolaceae bacterium]
MIRCSFVYLLLGIGLGAVLLVHKAYPLHPAVWQLLPIHIEITIFGWIIQLTLGTAYWMLPRFLEAPKRGSQWLGVFMVIILNVGILLTILDDMMHVELQVQLLGRCLELLAVIIFIRLHWSRIVTYRT